MSTIASLKEKKSTNIKNKNIKIALVGNPNCGKTTLFNQLTGSSQHVGNWPGVTVEKKEGSLKFRNVNIDVLDLPGIYSLSPYSSEEFAFFSKTRRDNKHCRCDDFGKKLVPYHTAFRIAKTNDNRV